MIINYLLPPDDDLRAKAVARAVFEDFNTEIGEHKGDFNVTITDKEPGFLVWDSETTKHGTLGWRLAAKQFSEVFFGVKCDVVKVGAAAEQYYLKAVENKHYESVVNKKSVIIQSASQSVDNQGVMEDGNYSKEVKKTDAK